MPKTMPECFVKTWTKSDFIEFFVFEAPRESLESYKSLEKHTIDSFHQYYFTIKINTHRFWSLIVIWLENYQDRDLNRH